jgi:hypothetical protein
MGVGVGSSMLLCQPSRCSPPLGGHELREEAVVAAVEVGAVVVVACRYHREGAWRRW